MLGDQKFDGVEVPDLGGFQNVFGRECFLNGFNGIFCAIDNIQGVLLSLIQTGFRPGLKELCMRCATSQG
jgi:hypothetical protein